MDKQVFIDKWAHFVLTENGWDVRFFHYDIKPNGGRVYRVWIPVPAELIGSDVEAEVLPE